MVERVKVQGMTCQHCVASVRNALESLGELAEISVDLESGEARFVRPKGVTMEQIKEAIEGAGYRVVQ